MKLTTLLPILSLAVLGLLQVGAVVLGVLTMQLARNPELAITTVGASILAVALFSTTFSLLRISAHRESVLQLPNWHVLLGLFLTAAEATFIFLIRKVSSDSTCSTEVRNLKLCNTVDAFIAVLGVSLGVAICHSLFHAAMMVYTWRQRRQQESTMKQIRPFTQLHDSSSQHSHSNSYSSSHYSTSRHVETQPQITSVSKITMQQNGQQIIFTNPFAPSNRQQTTPSNSNSNLTLNLNNYQPSPKSTSTSSSSHVPRASSSRKPVPPPLQIQKRVERYNDQDELPSYGMLGYGVGQQYQSDKKMPGY